MSTGNVIGIVGSGGGTPAVDAVTDGNSSPVTSNAVHDAIAALTGVTLDTDPVFTANSDAVAASQKATKTFVETRAIVDLGNFI